MVLSSGNSRDRFYANFPNSEPSPKLLRFFPFAMLHFTFFVLLPSSCFLVTVDTLRLIHKTPTSTPNVTFPQLRRDDAPHLPDSSRKRTSRFKKGWHFLFLLLTWKWLGQPGQNDRALQHWLLVWWEKSIKLYRFVTPVLSKNQSVFRKKDGTAFQLTRLIQE